MPEKPKSILGPAGETLMRNVKRVREEQRLTFVELSDRLHNMGRPIPVLGLRRIERGERRVDVDDLFALAVALKVAPVDLLVPGDMADNEPYRVTLEEKVTAAVARAWISGAGFLRSPQSLAELAELIRFMPKDRAQVASRSWFQSEAAPGVTHEQDLVRKTNAWQEAQDRDSEKGEDE